MVYKSVGRLTYAIQGMKQWKGISKIQKNREAIQPQILSLDI
ncbi:hypothetical protein V12B01_24414 [Vibrio splendidus 12B01]|nr:hypothetical protein V12B01_24414 [Vibrio splendidus 12B01]